MEPLLDLRVSRVAPMVEGNIVELVDMVKQMGRKGSDITESQNRKMVGYLGNLDEMRQQIVIMVQRYEDDPKVLKRLLELLDRIDDVKTLAVVSEASQPLSPCIEDDVEIARKYDTPFNPLMVSTLNILDVSGLFADNIKEEDLIKQQQEEEEEEAGDEFWDHEIDPSSLAPHDDTPQDVSSINLSMSNLHLPNLFDSGSNNVLPPSFSSSSFSPLLSSSQQASSSSAPSSPFDKDKKEKGKGKSKLSHSFSLIEADMVTSKGKGKQPAANNNGNENGNGKRKEKGKGKEKEKEKVTFENSSDNSETDSEEDVPNGASSWRRGVKPGAPFRPRPPIATTSASESESEKSSESESESGSSSSSSSSSYEARRIPKPPPMPSSSVNKKYRKKRGPCEPVTCKICYDDYNRHEQIYEFSDCKHVYCNECLNDYLTTHINEGAVLDLVCPFPECTTEVLPTDIKALCSGETIAKYERFTVLAALRADPNARWCPNPYCNNGIKYNASTMPWVNCNACSFEFCFHCMGERHDGAACGAEALAYLQKKKESEEAAQAQFSEWADLMQSFVKPCPGCKAFIEKNDGCNHMTCTNQTCRTQFCWLCLNVYSGDHFQDDINFPDCYDKQYYTPYLGAPPVRPAQPTIRRRRFTNVAKKVGMFVGVGVAVVTLGVPAAVIGGPVYGCFQLHKRLKARRLQRRTATYQDPNWVPPSPARIAEAAREARRLYELERS